MIKVPIQDNVFLLTGGKSMGGLCCDPEYIQWVGVATGAPARFYTEYCMRDAPNHPPPRIGWLIHAPPFEQPNYDWALKHEGEFDYILTYVKSYVERDPTRWLYYPCGGSRVPLGEWHEYPKRGLVSMLASFKDTARGHKLRHEIKGHYGDRLDVFGSMITGIVASKLDAIAPYCYSVVVSGESNDWCLPDHLLDCMALGTIPIFWGCPEVSKFFDMDGIIQFEKAGDLDEILNNLSYADFAGRLPSLYRNRELARPYRVPEDWIFEHYPFLFEGL